MFDLLKQKQAAARNASLIVGSDLRAGGSSREWRRLGLPGANEQARERVDRLFPGSEAAAYVLDVLASGKSREGVAIRLGGAGEGRYFQMNFRPLPDAGKPKKVLIEAWEMSARLVLSGDTGEVMAANRAAEEVFGNAVEAKRFVRNVTEMKAGLTEASRCGSSYLGRFRYRRQDGGEVELESMLVQVGV